MIQTWKVPHIVRGMLTYVPALNTWRLRRGVTGGSDSSRYCYAVWLRHLVTLQRQGFKVKGAVVAELGPGDSIGAGLAALLSGAERYVGLDVVPYSAKADLKGILADLTQMYLSKAPIPDHDEFPGVRPRLASYDFPGDLIDSQAVASKADSIMADLALGANNGRYLSYQAPWTSVADVAPRSIDLIFSHSVLQYVNDLEVTYRAMFAWLKPGGYCSHSIGFSESYLSPFWNGHWAYTDREWQMVRGRREFLINREPLSTHLRLAKAAGLDVLHLERQYADGGLDVRALSSQFQRLEPEDRRTRGVMLVLRRPV